MADLSYSPKVYREQGGTRFVIASTGSADVEAGGEIDIEAGGEFKVSGTAFITTGAKVDLSSARNWLSSGVYAAGPVKGTAVTSTGTGTFNAVTSTGIITGDSFTSTGGTVGSGKFNSVTSTGTGTFNALTSTGIITGDSFTSTGGTVGSGKFNSVTSTGTGTFNAVTSTGTGTFNAVTSTGLITGYGLLNTLVENVVASGVAASYGISIFTSSSGQVGVAATIVPVAGARKTLIIQSSVTSAAVSILTTGTWNGTNNTITISTTSGATEVLFDLVATSTARWRIIDAPASSNYTLS